MVRLGIGLQQIFYLLRLLPTGLGQNMNHHIPAHPGNHHSVYHFRGQSSQSI